MFLNECFGSQCAQAIRGISSALSGDGSFLHCDLLKMTYEGDATSSYEKGVRDQVVSKSAYLETLLAVGIMVESAYYTLTSVSK